MWNVSRAGYAMIHFYSRSNISVAVKSKIISDLGLYFNPKMIFTESQRLYSHTATVTVDKIGTVSVNDNASAYLLVHLFIFEEYFTKRR